MIRRECAPFGTHDSRTSQNPIAAKQIPKMRLQDGWHRMLRSVTKVLLKQSMIKHDMLARALRAIPSAQFEKLM
jgi:hypothetical protein